MRPLDERSEDIFLRLSEGSGGTIQIRDTDLELPGGKVAHAVEKGRRLLLLPLAEDETAAEDDDSRGVTLTERLLLDGGLPIRFQALVCELPQLAAQFGLLCDELWDELSEHTGRPAATAQAVLERWRDLLAPRTVRLLGAEALSGLLAELHVLEQVHRAAGSTAALRLWTGPEGARHDFVGQNGGVEVKSTTTRERFTVQIHGLGQLEPPPGGLVLYAEQVEQVPFGGDTVPDALSRLMDAGIPAHDLLSKLATLGYDGRDAEVYGHIRFRRVRQVAVEVRDPLPRLTSADLRDPGLADRLMSVRYSIDLIDFVTDDESVAWDLVVRSLVK